MSCYCTAIITIILIECPIKFDCGDEHVSIASTQYAMRENDDDTAIK